MVAEPLGGHVLIRSQRHTGLGQSGVGVGAGNAEIQKVSEIIAGDQDVLRLHVAVRDAAGVRGVQRGSDLTHDGHRTWRTHRPAPFQDGGQVGAVDQAHVQIELPVDLAVIVNGHDVRLGQPAGCTGLALHPGTEQRVVRKVRRYQLERHHPALAGVLGLVDLPQPRHEIPFTAADSFD